MARISFIFNSEDMERFLGQTFLALLLLTAISRVITWVAPAGWADEDMREKLAYWAEVQQGERPYNHVLIGSSHIFRQVDPGVLDRAVAEAGGGLRSFNLGVPDLASPESYQLTERLIDQATPDAPLRFITLEMTNATPKFRLDNRLIARNTHFMNLRELQYFIQNDHGSIWRRAGNVIVYLQMLIAGQFHIGHNDILAAFAAGGDCLWLDDEGFLSLDRQMRETGEENYVERHRLFQQNSTFNFDDVKATWAEVATLRNTADGLGRRPKQPHLDRMLAMIERARDKGIMLRFVMVPPKKAFPGFLATAEALPPGHFVQAADPAVLPPTMFEKELFFDRGHFNETGAALYSEAFAGIWLEGMDE